jgi:tRNA threonylcarbamoyladenosine biosynthesis protein TsaB
MQILAVDTAQAACSVALWRDGEIVGSRFRLLEKGHAEALLPMVEELRRDTNFRFEGCDAFAATIGPGTFAGIRVGLSAVRAFALAHKRPVVGIGTLRAIAASFEASGSTNIGAVIDARRDEVYFQAFTNDLEALSEPQKLPLEELHDHMPLGAVVLVGTGANLAMEILAKSEFEIGTGPGGNPTPYPDARKVAQLAAIDLADKGADAFRVPPAPLYLRRPDAKLPVRTA